MEILTLDSINWLKSSRKILILIRAANELMWGPVHFYIFDLAFNRSDHRKEVYTAMVKNGKDIIDTKGRGEGAGATEKGKKTFSGMGFVWAGQGYCFLTAGWVGGAIGPLVPIHNRGNSWGRHQSSPLLSPATHTHPYTESWAKEKQKATIITLFSWPSIIPLQESRPRYKHTQIYILSHKKYCEHYSGFQ